MRLIDVDKAIKILALTYKTMDEEEKEMELDKVGELYINNFYRTIAIYIEHKISDKDYIEVKEAIDLLPTQREQYKQTIINSIKRKFAEWDNE